MLNRATWDRLDTLAAQFRAVARQHPEALAQIALAELPEAVQQSNAIEASTLTIDDTERILAGHLPVRRSELREIFEAKNLAAVTIAVSETRDPLTDELILRWHAMLLAGIRDEVAGRFRRGDEWVRVGGHIGANPAFVPELVAEALRDHATSPDHIVDRIARFHCAFEVIHPFVDGNGRIGRVVMNKQLQDAGLPPVIVRARNRERDYYAALSRFGTTNQHDAMTRLLVALVSEAMHKRMALLTSRRIIALAEWARITGVSAAAATNKARRQTIPAFRLRGRWMIPADAVAD